MIFRSIIVLMCISQCVYIISTAVAAEETDATKQLAKEAKNSIIADMLPDLSWLHSPTAHLASVNELINSKSNAHDDDNLVMAASMMPGRRRLDDSQAASTEDLDTRSTREHGRVDKRSGDDFFEDDQDTKRPSAGRRSSDGPKNRMPSANKRGKKSKGSAEGSGRTGGGQESRGRGMKPLVGGKNFGRSSIEDLLGNNDEEAEDDEAERRSSDSIDYNDSNDDDNDESEQQSAEQSRQSPKRKSASNRRQSIEDEGENESAEDDEESDSSNDVRRSAKAPVPEKKTSNKKRAPGKSSRKTQKRSNEDTKTMEPVRKVNRDAEQVARNDKLEDDESTAAAASNQLKHSSAELQTAAGHHHGHSHGHYYQYAEVPKKKAWKFGYKRGNKKHTSKLP